MARARNDTDDSAKPSTKVGKWLSSIESAQKDFDTYDRRCDRILKRYLYEREVNRGPREFQMLWANQEILRPAVYARRPNPSVQSRFKDGDPVARVTSQLLERTLDVQFDLGDYNHAFQLVRNDYLLFARGVPRIRYEPEIELAEDDSETSEDEVGGASGDSANIDSDGQASGSAQEDESSVSAPQEVLKCEWVRLDYIARRDFIHPKSRNWKEVPWIAYRAFLSRAELEKRWPKVGKDIPLDAKAGTDGERENIDKAESLDDKATVFEIWDKINRRVTWIAKAHPEILEEDDPYLKLDGFFPSPRPAYGTLGDDLLPTPDYILWQDQANEINQLTARIAALTDSLKLVGFYEAGPEGEGSPEIEKAVRPGFENKLIAVKSFAAFAKGGGEQGRAPIVWLPVEMVATIIKECVELRKQLIDDVYQITGISDIMRGDTEAEETAAAQGIKSEWGAVRLKDKQNELARVARDVTRMVAEVISTQFQIETMLECANMKLPTDADVQQAQIKFEQELQQWKMQQIAQQQRQLPPAQAGAPAGPTSATPTPPSPPPAAAPIPVTPPNGNPPLQGGAAAQPQPPQMPDLGPTQEQVMALLRNGVLRRYVIDIETDSTIAIDQNAEQQRRTTFISEAAKFMTAMLPVAQESPMVLPFIGKLFLFGVRAFPTARELEEEAEKMVDKLEEAAGQPPAPKPEQVKLQADLQRAQVEIEKAKIGMQTEQMRAKAEIAKAQIDMKTAQADHGMKIQQMQLEGQQAQQAHQMAMAEHGVKMKTLAQQVQMDERKMAATQSLDIFKDGMERQRMQREATTGAPAAPQAALPAPAAPKKRKFAVVRNDAGRISGLSEE